MYDKWQKEAVVASISPADRTSINDLHWPRQDAINNGQFWQVKHGICRHLSVDMRPREVVYVSRRV